MSNFNIDENAPVLVEFEYRPGASEVALSAEDIAKRSAEAMDSAMNTIHNVARRVITTVDALPHRPTQIEVEFGIKLAAEAGALVTKTGVDATLNVRLTLQRETAGKDLHES